MKKIITLICLFVFSMSLVGCANDAEDGVEEMTEEVAQEESIDFTGVWKMTMAQGGGTIVTTTFAYGDGMVESVYSDVTTPEGHVGQASHGSWATYEIDGMDVTMVAVNGSATMTGTFSDATNASGMWTNGVESYSWTAKKAGELPFEYRLIGTWTFELNDYDTDLETNRWWQVHLNSDGTADLDYQKAQMNDGTINEGETPDYLNGYTYTDGHVVIEGEITFEGDMNIDPESGVEIIEGTWTNSDTGESGDWYAVKVGLN